MSTLSEKDKKIVRKRVAIFFIVGLSICFSDVAYRYISWELKKADKVQVENTGLWVSPEYLKERKIAVLEKTIKSYEMSIAMNIPRLEKAEANMALEKSKEGKESESDIRKDLNKTRERLLIDEKRSLEASKLKVQELKKELILLKNKEA